jgi:uncharacterized protein involved in outer membrane biogenesis
LRDILTGLAILLLLCLTGALVAPHFISWTNHREQVSRYLSETLGQPVEVRGAIAITLFPTPALKLSDVHLHGDSGVSGVIGRLRLTGSIPPLLRGELKIVSAKIDQARLALRPEKSKPHWSTHNASLVAISIENMTIADSSLSVQKSDGSTISLGHAINGSLEASSLIGPFRGSLNFKQVANANANEQSRTLRFSTGRIEHGNLRLKALVENESAAARTEFDGQLALFAEALSVDGVMTASGNAALPMITDIAGTTNAQVIWRLTAKAKGNPQSIAFDDLELALGQEDRQTIFTGNGTFDLYQINPGKLMLSARQIDVDRMLGNDNKQLPHAPITLLELLTRNVGKKDILPWFNGELDVSMGSITLGRGSIVGPRLILDLKQGFASVRRLTAELPGQSTVDLQGNNNASGLTKAALGNEQISAGNVTLESKDLPRFLSWFHGAPMRSIGTKALRISGLLSYDKSSVSVTQTVITADGFKMSGDIRSHQMQPRMKLDMALQAEQIEITKLPAIADLDGPDFVDLDIQFNANKVQLAGIGAGSIAIKARKNDGIVTIDAFSLKDIGGANLSATGEIGRVGSQLNAEIDAGNLDALLQLASRFSSHSALSFLASRPQAFVPAKLSLKIKPDQPESTTPTTRLEFNGRLKDTQVAGFLRLNEAGDMLPGTAVDVKLSAENSANALRQFGLEAISIGNAGKIQLHILGTGLALNEQEAPWSLQGEIANVAIDLKAKRTRDFSQPIVGQISLASKDIAPLAQSLLIAVPAVSPGQPLDLKADFDLRGYKITLRNLEAKSDDAYVRGELAFNLAEFGRVSGQLKTSEVDIHSFSPLIFGVMNPASPTEMWSDKPFGIVSPVTLPGDLWINAESILLRDDLRASNASFVLRFENGLIYLEHAEADLLGAKLKGAATLRRIDKAVSVSGRVAASEAELGRDMNQSPLQGKADGDIEFSAVADSPARLIANLSGAGRARLRDAVLNGVKPGVLTDTISAALNQFETTLHDQLSAKLLRDLNGSASIPAVQIPLILSAGVLRAGPIPVVLQQEDVSTSVAIDFKNISWFSEAIIRLRDAPKQWDGAVPTASVIWQGPLSKPVMRVEATALANGLTTVNILRESERIETMERQQRERAILNNRLQSSQEEQRDLQEKRRRLNEAQRQQAARKQAEDMARRQPSPQPRLPNAPSSGAPAGPTIPPPLVITPSLVR